MFRLINLPRDILALAEVYALWVQWRIQKSQSAMAAFVYRGFVPGLHWRAPVP